MSERRLVAVTGAFGYSGSRIAAMLHEGGVAARTLTNSPRRADDAGPPVDVYPLSFDEPARLVEALRGVDALVNTYWVRFNHPARRTHPGFTFARAVENTRALFSAARRAGVGRVVHVSITNPSDDSPFEYFRGKAAVERALRDTGIPHSILRPAVLFGGNDILINNIAWMLRRLPVLGVFGDGAYRLRPIHVDDLAELAVRECSAEGNRLIQAVGPESYTYRELVRLLGECIGCPRPLLRVSPRVGWRFARLLGCFVGDVVLTLDEVRALMAGLLHVDGPPAGPTRLADWARAKAETLGRTYASELARRAAHRKL